MKENPRFDTPYDAVFICKFGKKGTTLFEKQRDLSEAIRHNPDSGFSDKSDLTVRSALSQIFNGERNLSRSLRKALFLALEPLFDKKQYDFEKFERDLIKKFAESYKKRLEYKINNKGDRDYDKLIAVTEQGESFLITTLEPAELHKSELADRLKNQLLEKTGIVAKESSHVKSAHYKFFLPDTRIARQFWEALENYAVYTFGLNQKDVQRKLMDANKNRRILTYIAGDSIAMHPYVFIDLMNPKKRTGFCVSYRNSDIPSVAELSINVVEMWLKEMTTIIKGIEDTKEKNYFIYD